MRLFHIFRKKSRDVLLDAIAESMDRDIHLVQTGTGPDLSALRTAPPPYDEEQGLEGIFSRLAQRRNRRRRMLYRAAAAVLLLVVAGAWAYVALHRTPAVYDEIYARKGETLVVILPDGSRVRLNADSRLAYPRQFSGDDRRVRLQGEAFFEVSKDKSRPFYVDCYDMEVKVTGTRFNVEAYPENPQVVTTLYEGRVSVGSRQTPEGSRKALLPGQKALYARSTRSLDICAADTCLDDLWTHRAVSVQDMRLDDLLRLLERRYGVRFAVKNPRIRHYTYNLSCSGANLQDVFDVMQTITPIHISKAAGQVYEVR